MASEIDIEDTRYEDERDEMKQRLEAIKEELSIAYKEALEKYYETKGLSQESFYEGMCLGLETGLRKVGCDEEDIAQLQEGAREEVADAYAEKKFFAEHGHYPDAGVNE